jgi:putative membrane protein
MKNLAPIILGSLIATAPALAQQQPQSPPLLPPLFQPPPDSTWQPDHPVNAVPPAPVFVSQVETGTQMEIQSSELALSKSQSPRVRQVAERMIRDHTKAAEDLHRTIAADPSIMPPPQGVQPPPDAMQGLAQLQYSSGPDFDRNYLAMMLRDHQQTAALFRAYANGGENPRLRAFARRTLPVIEAHLRAVERLQREEAASR